MVLNPNKLKVLTPQEQWDAKDKAFKSKKKNPKNIKLDQVRRQSALSAVGDRDQVLAHLSKFKDIFRYDVKNVALSSYRSALSPKTVKKTFTQGHIDCEVWMYINRKKKVTKRHLSGFRSTWVTIEQDNHFVLDFDNYKKANTAEEMANCLPIKPAMVVMTSPNSFHVVYFTNRKALSKEEIADFAYRLVGSPKDDPLRTSEQAFKDTYGLDLCYLRQTHKQHKIRVPGTVNSKHKGFVCSGWMANNFKTIDIDSLDKVIVESPKKERVLNKTAQKNYESFLRGHFNNKTVAKLAKYFAVSAGFLAKGNLAISQTAMAKDMKILQTSVSRILKKLANIGFLTVTNDNYNYKVQYGKIRCKEYGMGQKLSEYIASKNEAAKAHIEEVVERLGAEYEPGTRNEQIMEDVRNLRYLNVSLEDKIAFIQKKMETYISCYNKRQMNEEDIVYTIENWEQKAQDLKTLNLAIAMLPTTVLLLKQIGLHEAKSA